MRSGRESLQKSLHDIQRDFRISSPHYPVFSKICAPLLLRIHAFPDFVKYWDQSVVQFNLNKKNSHCFESQAELISFKQKIQEVDARLEEWNSCLEYLLLLRMGQALRHEAYNQTIVKAIEYAYPSNEKSHQKAMKLAIKAVQRGVDGLLVLNIYRVQLSNIAKGVERVKAELDVLLKPENNFGDSIGRMSSGFHEALCRESLFSTPEESDNQSSQSLSLNKLK